MDRRIPHTMSTQHPDNARPPPWCKGEVIQGDNEVYEAYFAYKELGCEEVMWDSEGKDVDTRVVRKLLAGYGDYFKDRILGEDVFLTYRIPNPRIEGAERKLVIETLESIPISYDTASTFYGRYVKPVFEVILPFTTDEREPIWLYNCYRAATLEVEKVAVGYSKSVGEWIGRFEPRAIEVIPLIEDMNSMLRADRIVKPYIEEVKPDYLRVFLARSDPALNYGLLSAVLLVKVSLSKLKVIELEKGTPLYPIIGVGPMPFRGHLSPGNLDRFMEEYRGFSTVTIQSSLKYDLDLEEAELLVRRMNSSLPYKDAKLFEFEDKKILRIMDKLRTGYQEVVEDLAPLINSLVPHVPRRRARKLHIGLFGYSRSVGRVSLPRAIPFTAVLYSIGMPPEFIGLRAIDELDDEEWDIVRECYVNFDEDLREAGYFISWRNLNLIMDSYTSISKLAEMSEEELRKAISKFMEDLTVAQERLGVKLGPRSLYHKRYENVANSILISYLEGDRARTREYFDEAARMRGFIG